MVVKVGRRAETDKTYFGLDKTKLFSDTYKDLDGGFDGRGATAAALGGRGSGSAGVVLKNFTIFYKLCSINHKIVTYDVDQVAAGREQPVGQVGTEARPLLS